MFKSFPTAWNCALPLFEPHFSMSFSRNTGALTSRYFWLSVVMLTVFLSTFILHYLADTRIENAQERRHIALLLADELRQTSDDLTRMARTYVVTANPIYKEHYREIVDIRNGKRPRPRDSANVYWDLVMTDDRRPRGMTAALPLLDLMRQNGFSKEEISILKRAKSASDRLTKTEYDAMSLVAPNETHRSPRRQRATMMLHDETYHEAKASVMGPIAEFNRLTDARTRRAVKIAAKHANAMRIVLVASGLLLLLLFWRLSTAIYRNTRTEIARETLFRAVFENAAVGLAQIGRDGRVLNANQAFCEMLSYEKEHLLSPRFHFGRIFFSDTVRMLLFDEEAPDCEHKDHCVLTEPCRTNDGRRIWMHLFLERVAAQAETGETFVAATLDITAEKEAAEELAQYRKDLEERMEERTKALKQSEERFRFIAESTYDVIWTMDLRDEKLTYVSPSVFRQRGFTPEEVISSSPWNSLTPESAEEIRSSMTGLLDQWKNGETNDLVRIQEVEQPHKNGSVITTEIVISLHCDKKGRPVSILGVTRDVTERKRAEQEIRRLAFYDGLTHLPNRRMLLDRLVQSMSKAEREQYRVALLFIDLDKFKPVNDTLGHEIGDELLQQAARRMEKCLRPYDTAARIGGDEFIILLPDLIVVDDAIAIAERVRKSIEKEFVLEKNKAVSISASIGVALYPDHADNERDLMRVGDEAMYLAKKSGRNKVEIIQGESLPFKTASYPGSAQGPSLRLTWKPAFACGEPAIDEEHRALFRSANQVLSAAMGQPENHSEISPVLDRLLKEVASHFSHEESILANNHFEGLERHIHKHRSLLLRADDLQKRVADDSVTMRELVSFLAVDVVTQHILTDDREYFSSFGVLPIPENRQEEPPSPTA